MQCCNINGSVKQALRPITAAPIASFVQDMMVPTNMDTVDSDMNRSQEVGYFNSGGTFFTNEEPLDINLRNLENLSLMDNFSGVTALTGIENNENLVYFHDFESVLNPYIDDPKEGNISRTVRVPSSEHVAEIVGRQGCKIKDLRARTNTYIKTPMRTQSPVFVVTGKEDAVLHVMEEIQNAAEHFTHIRASRNHHKLGGSLDSTKSMSREGDIMIQVTVPYRVVGLVVGLKGQTIKAIQQDTDTFIVTPNRDKAPIFEIRGQPDNVERAKTMILRHIETRTRHCRLQDTTNLPTSWSDDQRQNGNDYSCYHNETPPQNGHSSSDMSIHTNFNTNGTVPNGGGFNSPGTGFNIFSSTSPPSQGNQNWRGYGNMGDQLPAQNGHFATWSIATSDYNPMPVSSRANNLMNSVRSCNSFQYNMSVGSTSSSNSSSSISPPQDFVGEGSFSSQHLHNPFGISMNSPSLRGMSDPTDPSAFTSFPLLTSAPATATKGSLVLGNLFQSNNNVTSSLGMNSVSNIDSLINGGSNLHGEINEELNRFAGSLKSSSMASFTGALVGDASLFTSQITGFPSGDSSPASKSCSMSETSGSQSSPTPRVCKICEEADVVAALVPCGHNLFCMECAEGIVNKPTDSERKCPVCKDAATDVLRIRA